jgi:dipeptidyl aminopeptidase/acylaminoacyl peptidase
MVVMARGDPRVPNAHSLRLVRRLAGPVWLAMIEGERHGSLPRAVTTQEHLTNFVR